jgi:hypothetical protein
MDNQTIVSKENILELLVELGIMPEDAYQEFIKSVNHQKAREIFAINAIGLILIQEMHAIPIDLKTTLTTSAEISFRIFEALGKKQKKTPRMVK